MDIPADWSTGKLCYVELPAVHPEVSAEFYRRAFGWSIGRRSDGSLTFGDTVGGVSGTFATDRPPATDPGLLLYVMVADARSALAAVTSAGGRVVRETPEGHGEVFAWFADPAGNVLGIYQQPGLAAAEAERAVAGAGR
jgi:predicted enzyme related to lactoylglutathione lyase